MLFRKFMIPPMVPVPPRGRSARGSTSLLAMPQRARSTLWKSIIAQTGGRGSAEHGETEQHAQHEHGFAHRRLVVAARDQVIDQPAADAKTRNRGANPGDRSEPSGFQYAHVHGLHEVVRQPGQKQVERVTVGRKANRQAPYLPVAQQIPKHGDFAAFRWAFSCGAAGTDVVTLDRAQPRMATRVAVDD